MTMTFVLPDKNQAMGIIVRRARVEDTVSIHHILAAAFRNMRDRGYSHRASEAAIVSPQEINQRILKDNHVFVAVVDGCILGTATGIEEHETLHICSLAVHPDHWGRGIGRRLMETLEIVARSQGCHKVWLQTAWSMDEAISLYEGLGYKQEGYQPRQFYGEDFLLFGKELSRPDTPNISTPILNGAIILFPGVEELDFVGVYEVLTKTNAMAEEGKLTLEKPPRISLLARLQRITCANGLVVHPHDRIQDMSAFDFIVLPGGRGVKALQKDGELLNALRTFEAEGKVISSVCTGAFVLAWAGILEGRKATTHHHHRGNLAKYCEVVAERVVSDGSIVTAAGISASLDLGLQLVNRFYGPSIAKQVAIRIEYTMI